MAEAAHDLTPDLETQGTTPATPDDFTDVERTYLYDEYGVDVDDVPHDGDEAARDAYVSNLLYACGKVDAELRATLAAKQKEHDAIDLRYGRREAQHRAVLDRLLGKVEAEAVRADFGGSPKRPKKSRVVGFGSYGRKQIPRKVAVTDEPRFILWASAHLRDCLRGIVKLRMGTWDRVFALVAYYAAVLPDIGGAVAPAEGLPVPPQADEALALLAEIKAAMRHDVVTTPLAEWYENASGGEEPPGVTVTQPRDEPWAKYTGGASDA